MEAQVSDDDKQCIARAVARAAEDCVKHLLAVDYARSREQFSGYSHDSDVQLTAEQKDLLRKSYLYRQLRRLAATAYQPGSGLNRVGRALSVATRFFRSNGMGYRLLEQMAERTPKNEGGGSGVVNNVEALGGTGMIIEPL